MDRRSLLNLSTLPQPKAQAEGIGHLSSLLMGTRTFSGQYVNQETATRAAAVLSCLRIISEDVSALPLRLKRRTPRGAEPVTDVPLARLLSTAPNEVQTSMEMRESLIWDLFLHGQCFVQKQFDRNGITALWPLAAGRIAYMSPQPGELPPGAPLKWNYSDPHTGPRILLSDDLWRMSMMSRSGFLEGRALILLAREAIGLALAAEQQGARLFSQGLQTDVVFKSSHPMGKDEKDELRRALTARHAGSDNAWRPILLEGDMDVTKIGLTAQESQYLESRAYQLADIGRIFRVPDVLLGVSQGKSSTYASAEQFFLAYLKYTITPWTERIEQTISRDLIPASAPDLFAEHDTDVLARADLATRYTAHAAGIQAGFLTRNEARSMENLPALDGLDEPLTQLNMGSGQSPIQSAGRLAHQLAKNAVAHEMKLIADGKPKTTVYGTLLPGYLASKCGLTDQLCRTYCEGRLQTESTEAEGVQVLSSLLLGKV